MRKIVIASEDKVNFVTLHKINRLSASHRLTNTPLSCKISIHLWSRLRFDICTFSCGIKPLFDFLIIEDRDFLIARGSRSLLDGIAAYYQDGITHIAYGSSKGA